MANNDNAGCLLVVLLMGTCIAVKSGACDGGETGRIQESPPTASGGVPTPDPQVVRAALIAGAQAACEGRGTAGAAAYQPGTPGVHPVLIPDGTALHAWNASLPATWAPATLAAAQLAVCVGPVQEHRVQVCHYHGPAIERFRNSQQVRLVEIATGREVASQLLRGGEPRRCQRSEPYDLTRIDGDAPNASDVVGWVRGYVER